MEQPRGFELRTVLTSAGGDIATDATRCREALTRSGLFPPHQVEALVAATTAGVAYGVWVGQGQGPAPRLADLTVQVQRSGIDPAPAEWAVRTWADAVGAALEGAPQYGPATGGYPATGRVGAAYPPTQVVDEYPPTSVHPAAAAGPGGYGPGAPGGPGAGGPPPWVGAPPPSTPIPPGEKRSQLPLVIGAVAAFVLIAAAVIAFVVFSGDGDEDVIAGDGGEVEETTTTDDEDETTTTEDEDETTTTDDEDEGDDQLAADTELIVDLWEGLDDAFAQSPEDGAAYLDEHNFPGMTFESDACQQSFADDIADNGWTEYTEVYEIDESSIEPDPDFVLGNEINGPAAGQAPDGRVYVLDITVDAIATPDPPTPEDFAGPVHATIIDGEAFLFFNCVVD
ncbi:MAG: hypothetical protein ACRD29_25825 [Acidimicrobiales bacterium]